VRIAGRPDRCAVAVMAKAPRIGEVKTRLVPPLSPTEAASLGGCFIQDIAGNILAAARDAPIEGYVAYSPPGSEAAFEALLPAEIGLLKPRRVGLGNALFDAAAAVGDLREVGLAGGLLLGAEGAVVGGGGVQLTRLQTAPQEFLVALRPERRRGPSMLRWSWPWSSAQASVCWPVSPGPAAASS